MPRTNIEFQDWKTKAESADILQEAVNRGAKLKRIGREHTGPCPACGGRDRFSVNVAKRIFNCRGSGGGDVIGMVMHLDGVSFMQACEALTGEAAPGGHSKPLSASEMADRERRRVENEAIQRRRVEQEKAYQEDTREAALSIWNASKPIKGTCAESYLKNRGFDEPSHGWPIVFRFHPSLPHPDGGKHPVLVCRVDDVSGELTGVWRIFLTEAGGKANVQNVKLGLGPASGGAVRIGGVGSKIGIAEGVESALGAWLMCAEAFPVWAALSTSGMSAFEPPLEVEKIRIFPDGDAPIRHKDGECVPIETPPGRKAALALKASLEGTGIDCVIGAEPSPGKDYCDLWNAMRDDAA